MSTLKPALVVAAHGSKVPGWARPVQDFVRDVSETPGIADVFSVVGAGYLEDTTPSLADACEAYLKAGAPEVVVVPLFLTASTHQSEDVPGILGLPGPLPHVRRRLVAEGVRVLPPGLPIKLAPLGEVGEILYRNASRRVALHTPTIEEARGRSGTAIVLVAYGSTIHHEQWESLMHDVRLRLLTAGFGGVAHAYVGHVAQLSHEPTAKAILHAAEQAGVKRVFVVPLLLAVSELQTGPIAQACKETADALHKRGIALFYAQDAILPDGDLAARAGFRALEAMGIMPPIGLGRRARAGLA
ncbi:MAG: hypothetical protein IT385_28350 [Deltaproteobacteria bacterium]|nr:hypothetical protein [Deltaproteobacteria bacterium]